MTIKEDAYEILTRKLDFPGSARLRAILEELMTPQQARIAAELPGSPEEVAQKLGLPVDTVKKELDVLFIKGAVIPRDLEKRDYYTFAKSTMDLREFTEVAADYVARRDRKYYGLWVDFVKNEWRPWYAMKRRKAGRPYSRVLPAYKAIEDLPGILPYEDIRELLKAQPVIAAVPCPCRYEKLVLEDPCEITKEEDVSHCLLFGERAERTLKRGAGARLSMEEALKLVDKIEEDGLIHRWFDNKADMVGNEISCQCCRECCVAHAFIREAGIQYAEVWSKSRYQAYVDLEKCTGCQICVDRCQFDAIEMQRPEGSKKYKAVVDAEKCFGCGACVVTCEAKAMKLKVVRPPEHISGELSPA